MGIIVDTINSFAKSKPGTKLYKWAASDKGRKFLCNTLPTLETVVATSCYVISTEKQKELDRREKNVLQWQNVIPGLVGIVAGTYLNTKVFAFGDKVIKHLDTQKVPDVHKIMGALRVALPLISTSILMRWCLPVATAFVSGEIEEYRNNNKNKLDIKA